MTKMEALAYKVQPNRPVMVIKVGKKELRIYDKQMRYPAGKIRAIIREFMEKEK